MIINLDFQGGTIDLYIRTFELLHLIFPSVSMHYTIASLSFQVNFRNCYDGGVGNECVFADDGDGDVHFITELMTIDNVKVGSGVFFPGGKKGR